MTKINIVSGTADIRENLIVDTHTDSEYVEVVHWSGSLRRVVAQLFADGRSELDKAAVLREAGFNRSGNWMPEGHGWWSASVLRQEVVHGLTAGPDGKLTLCGVDPALVPSHERITDVDPVTCTECSEHL